MAPLIAALTPHLVALLVLFARAGTIAMLLPGFADDAIPRRIRLSLGAGLSIGLYGLMRPAMLAVGPADGLIAILIAEMMVGLALGMLLNLLFHAAAMAGSIASLQVGLSSAMVFDPAQGGQAPLLSRFAAVAATVACFALNLHHLWIAAIVRSYRLFPIGRLPPAAGFADLALTVAGQSLTLAVGMAAPLLLYGILFNVTLALAARMAPAIQIFLIAQPLNILLGLALLATVLGTALTAFADAMGGFLVSAGLA